MTLITPVGNSSFNWSPKEETLLKTASTGETVEQTDSDKDALFAAAKAVVEAQMAFEEEVIEEVMPPMGGELIEDISDESEEVIEDAEDVEEILDGDDAPEASGDVQDAVAELVEKAEKAEEVAEAVTDALSKVEEAVQDVKSAVGGCEECAEGELADPLEDDVSEIEIEIESPCEDGICDEDEDEDEIIQESEEDEGSMKSAASDAKFVTFASLSATTKKKVYTYYTKYLGYPTDYAKLLVTDYE